MTPTQGEHAQTEALRPKFGDLLRNTMASESNPRRDAYFIREVHRSGGGVNPGRWFEMTDGKGETWLSNPQNMVSAAPAQPAAPQGGAEVNWWEADGDKYDASISPMQPAQGVAYAELPEPTPDELRAIARKARDSSGSASDDCGSAAYVLYGWRAAIRASNGQAPVTQQTLERNAVPAEWLEQAYREGWAACRDAETIGGESEDWSFGNSTANSRMIDAQQAAPQPTPTAQAAPAAGAVAGPGWKLVPVEPTDAMVQAAHHIDLSYMPGQEGADRAAIYRAMLAAAPTPAAQADSQPAMDRDSIREIFMTHGFTVKEGQTDLKQYVYDAADALLRAARAPADSVLEDAARWFSERDNVLHSFWVLLGEAETQADNDNNPLLKHQVEGFYRQWNALNGSALEPRWVTRAARKQGGA